MKYVSGETLRQRLSYQTQHPMALADAVGVSAAIGSALCIAHAENIVHRDIKPENVMIRRDGLVKVLDFGLAKLVGPAEDSIDGLTALSDNQTHPGMVLGTPAYMSPQQARGEAVDHRTDIWSLGIVTFEMVAGHVPFRGRSSSDVLAAILDREPPPLARFEPDAPAELQRIISKALRKHPDQRYQTAKDLRLDLQALHDDLKSHGNPVKFRSVLICMDTFVLRGAGATDEQAHAVLPRGLWRMMRIHSLQANMFSFVASGRNLPSPTYITVRAPLRHVFCETAPRRS
jgi:eukaryotic-like serine/threonine-protein kinase